VVTVARLADRTGVLGNPFGWLLFARKSPIGNNRGKTTEQNGFRPRVVDPSGGGMVASSNLAAPTRKALKIGTFCTFVSGR
jgi:hypothetical protein